MTTRIIGITTLALMMSLLAAATAADPKAIGSEVQQVATALEKNQADQAKKLVGDLARKYDPDDVMNLFKLRTKGGFGVGPQPGAIEPDGMERKLTELAKQLLPAKQLAEEAAVLSRMAYQATAVAQILSAQNPPKDFKGNKKQWGDWSGEFSKAALELAAAAKDKNAEGVRKAAGKLDRSADASSCNKCHSQL
ncbi:hypothetical protein AYO44_12725 [Planctomycetaceae bacterium SCGC AG-212-F19]|nr:hypothetical protein AYO44_12725 [Planctomycetaceae bacterium SCGC AG-212-F19]